MTAMTIKVHERICMMQQSDTKADSLSRMYCLMSSQTHELQMKNTVKVSIQIYC